MFGVVLATFLTGATIVVVGWDKGFGCPFLHLEDEARLTRG